MSCFEVQISPPSGTILEIETCSGQNSNNIVIEQDVSSPNLTISQCVGALSGDINNIIIEQINNHLVGGSGILLIPQTGQLTISATGFQPTGNYANSIHNHNISDIIGLSGILDNKQNVILNPVAGTGSSNHIAYWNSISGITYDDNQLYWDSSSNELGIGTNNPARNIDIVSSAGTSVGIKLNSTAVGGRSYSFFSTNNNSSLGGGKFGMYDDTAQSSRLVIDGNGNIGVGINSPSYKLEVVGTGNFTQNLLVNSIPVSVSGHIHNSNDITNFNSAVSGLLVPYALLNSPAFSGIPTVPTASSGTNTNQIASTSFVRNEISNLVDSAPSTLDTLNELAAALGDDPNFATTITNTLASKANLSGAIFTGSVTIPSGTANFNSLSVNGTSVSISGHTHTSSNITDFNSSVSGLLPSISGSGYVSSSFNNNIYTISVSGLQPSGNYSLIGHTHNSSDILDFNTAVSGLLPNTYNAAVPWTVNHTLVDGTRYLVGDLVYENGRLYKANYSNESIPVSSTLYWTDVGPGYRLNIDGRDIPNIPYPVTSVNGYSGIVELSTSDLDDFNSSVSGLIPVKNISGSGYVNVSSSSGNFTVSVTGLQPSGNYANTIHNHGNITSSGTIGSTIDQVLITDTDGVIIASDYAPKAMILYDPTNDWDIFYFLDTTPVWTTEAITNDVPEQFRDSINAAASIHSHGNISSSGAIGSTSGLLVITGNSGILTTTSGISSSYITNFNSAVSGLLPVKNIVGDSGISVSSVSGEYTIATTGNFGLTTEEVDDRVSQLLVAGTGVNLTYNDASGTLTIDNLHSEINVLSQEPQGFVNRTDSAVSFNDATRTFTIQPAVSGGSYTIYAEGVKVVKSGIETVVLGSGTALNYIHFDTTSPHTLHTKTTGFNFDTDIPIAFIHWNGDISQSTFFGEERHGIRMDSVTHKWIHNTFGMQYISGLSIGGYVLLGDGSSNSHAQIDISDGILYQEDIIINITDDNGTNSANEFVQPLSPIAYIPVYYHSGSTGQWVRDVATTFPLKYNATRAQYNLYSGGTWTTPNVPNNRYFAMWIVATNDINDPILAIMGQREDSSLTAAESNNNWSDINLTNIPTQELRPLYRLIFVTNDTFTNTPKSSLQSILDIRVAIQSTVAGVTQNDHGSLFGLADDDHSQYVHIDNNRIISAVHNFANGLVASGLISAASGNFTTLQVNGTGVSVSGHTHTSNNITDFNSSVSGLLPSVTGTGYVNTSFNSNIYTISVTGLQPSGNYANATHTHTSSDITNFNSSVSGLLPTIANSGDNRILTSTGSSVGINAESNLTFDGSTLNIDGNLVFDSFTESVVAIGNSSTSQTLSLASGTVQTCTLTGNCTFTMPTATAGKSFTLFLNTGSGSYTANFSGVLWNDSSPPTITTTASKVDILSFISDGSYWYGSYSQNYG